MKRKNKESQTPAPKKSTGQQLTPANGKQTNARQLPQVDGAKDAHVPGETLNTTSPPVKTGETGNQPPLAADAAHSTPASPTSKKIIRGSGGQFLKGTHANPTGRPRRNTSEATLFARMLLEESAPELAQLAIQEAKAGNPVALKLCLERLMPIAQDRTVHVPLPAGDKTPRDMLAAHTAVLRAVATGDITPQEGQNVSNIVEARRRSWESVELAGRMTNLEDRLLETLQQTKGRK